MIDENALNIYTDGSSRSKPRTGGVGIRFIYVDTSGDEIIEDLSSPGYKGATNNEMELNACILALKNSSPFLQKRFYNKIIIFTDSKYVVDNYKNAMFLWPRTKWLKKAGAPVLNAHLWKDLIRNVRNTCKRVEIVKVKGHSKDKHNRAVDKLAKLSAQNPLNKPLAVSTVRRKKSKKQTQIGSVEMLGQRITIRIIECKYLSVQRIYRYRYEVMSRKSPYYGKVDFLCSTEVLREAHTFSVHLNSDKNNPGIEKVFKEVLPKVKKNSSPPTSTGAQNDTPSPISDSSF